MLKLARAFNECTSKHLLQNKQIMSEKCRELYTNKNVKTNILAIDDQHGCSSAYTSVSTCNRLVIIVVPHNIGDEL